MDAAKSKDSCAPGPPPIRPTLLIVDDEDMVRGFTRKVLERCGYVVLEAGDGLSGIHLFRTSAPDIAAVILDLSMPGMNGVEVFTTLRGLDPYMPVVFMTGYDPSDELGPLADGTGVRCLQKPFSPSLLTETLQDLLEPESSLEEIA